MYTITATALNLATDRMLSTELNFTDPAEMASTEKAVQQRIENEIDALNSDDDFDIFLTPWSRGTFREVVSIARLNEVETRMLWAFLQTLDIDAQPLLNRALAHAKGDTPDAYRVRGLLRNVGNPSQAYELLSL